MATVTWSSSGSTSWNTGANWSGGSVPGSSDDVVFDGTSTVNCTCDVAIDIGSLTVASGYSGTLDLGSSYNHLIRGNLTLQDGTLDAGSDNAIEVQGSFEGHTGGTLTQSSSVWTFSGSGQSWSTRTSQRFYKLIVTGSYTLLSSTVSYAWCSGGGLEVSGSLVVEEALYIWYGPVVIKSTGSLSSTGSGWLRLVSDCLEIETGGSLSCELRLQRSWWIKGSPTISGSVTIQTSASTATTDVTDSAGQTITFAGDVLIIANTGQTLNFNGSTYNPSLVFLGDLAFEEQGGTGVLNWSKGTGSITLSGTSDQTITTSAGWTDVLEDIVIDKTAGRVTLAGNLYTDSLTFDDGDLDLNGNTIYSAGSVEVNGNTGARFWNGTDSDMDNGKIDIDSGTLTLTGSA